MKFYQPLEQLKEWFPDFNYQTALWASCGYCDTIYYCGQEGELINCTIDMPESLTKGMMRLHKSIDYVNWWLYDVHMKKCRAHQKYWEELYARYNKRHQKS